MLPHHVPNILKSFANVKTQRPKKYKYQKGMRISMANEVTL